MSVRVRAKIQAVPRQTGLATGSVINQIKVAAGILVDKAGRALITERVGDTPFAGLWEFPGGKLKDGEATETALRRELLEELGVSIKACEYFMHVDHSYPDRQVSLDFYIVTNWSASPRGLENQRIRWLPLDELEVAELLPADAPVVSALRTRSASLMKRLSGT